MPRLPSDAGRSAVSNADGELVSVAREVAGAASNATGTVEASRPAAALARRQWLQTALGGGTFTAMGAVCALAPGPWVAQVLAEEPRKDGRSRLPPGQYPIVRLRPMGGEPGDGKRSTFELRVHGEVSTPLRLTMKDLLALDVVDETLDVHCVTKWSVFGARFSGVRVATLAKLAGVKANARHVIFESVHGYTANVSLKEALAPQNLVSHKIDGEPYAIDHGAPVRAIIPDLYFWKSAKWLTGIRFVARDEPGYWETRGYHNHADPWLEERYS